MSDYSNTNLTRLPIPDFELDGAGGGERRWRLRTARPLPLESFTLLQEIATAASTQEVQCSWGTVAESIIELVVHSSLHPGSDRVMFITREVLARAIDRLPDDVVELEGRPLVGWLQAQFLRANNQIEQ